MSLGATEFSESHCTENARSRACLLVTQRSLVRRLSENSVLHSHTQPRGAAMACVASEGRNESDRAKWQDASLALQTAVLERGGCCLLARFTYS